MSTKKTFNYHDHGTDNATKKDRDWVAHYCAVAFPSTWRDTLCTLLRTIDRLEEEKRQLTSADVAKASKS